MTDSQAQLSQYRERLARDLELRDLPARTSASTPQDKPRVSPIQEEMTMDWNRVEGNWKQFKGAAKEKWGKLTDDDLNVIEGRREQLEGKLQQRYGFAKDQISKDVDDWFGSLK